MPEVLGIVPARGGSKGIPGKNLAEVAGRPLLAWAACGIRESRVLTRAVLSTEDDEIARVGRAWGLDVPFMRPLALAGDDSPMIDVVRHALGALAAGGYRPGVAVLLQPTSPLRRGEHIDAAVERLEETGADVVVSVVEVPHQFSPASVMRLDGDRLAPWMEGPVATRRQDKPRLFARNGPAVLAARTAFLERAAGFYDGDTRALVMPPESSIDVDTAWDLAIADWILRRRHGDGT